MLPYRRALSLRPVKSEKQEVTFSNLGTAGATVQHIAVVTATDGPTTAGEVNVGDTVKWINVEVNISPEQVTETKVFHWIIWKKLSTLTNLIPSTYDDSNKRLIIRRGMEMLVKDVNFVVKRMFPIVLPKSYRRFGEGQQLFFSYVTSSANTVNTCGFFVYKNYS